MVACEPDDASVRCCVAQLGAQGGEPVDRCLCGLLVCRAGPVLAEFGAVEVVANKDDERRVDVGRDGEGNSDCFLVMDWLEVART